MSKLSVTTLNLSMKTAWRSIRTILCCWLLFILAGCANYLDPDPGRIRVRYPHDLTFAGAYFDSQQTAGYWEVKKLNLVNNYLIMASRDIRNPPVFIHILDVSTPTAPKEVAIYETRLTTIDDMFVIDGYIFLAGRSDGVEIIDIKDITKPVHAAIYQHSNQVRGSIAYVNHYLYYSVPTGQYPSSSMPKWHILDVLHPEEVRFVKEVSGLYEPMAVYNHLIIAAPRTGAKTPTLIQIIDVSNSENPVILSETQLEIWVYGIEINHNLAYISAGNGLIVLDITDPYTPSVVKLTVVSGDDNAVFGSFAQLDIADNVIVGDFIFALKVEAVNNEVKVTPWARLNSEKFREQFCHPEAAPYGNDQKTKEFLCSVPTVYVSSGTNDLVVANGFVYIASKRTGLLIFQLPIE